GQRVLVAAGHRAEHGAALAPQRVSDLADAGAPGALLPPGLLARAADRGPVLRLVRAAALRRVLLRDRFPDKIGVHAAAEDLILEIEGADRLFAQVDDVNL